MALRALHNTDFGFPAECFVCDPANPAGLRLSFVCDDEAGRVWADFALGAGYAGAPRFVHGGLLLAIMDEAMAWAAIAVAGRFAVSRTSRASFRRPVMLSVTHRVEAGIDDHDDASVSAWAHILNGEGKRCAQSTGRLVVLSEDAARAAIGADLGDNARYVRAEAGGASR